MLSEKLLPLELSTRGAEAAASFLDVAGQFQRRIELSVLDLLGVTSSLVSHSKTGIVLCISKFWRMSQLNRELFFSMDQIWHLLADKYKKCVGDLNLGSMMI